MLILSKASKSPLENFPNLIMQILRKYIKIKIDFLHFLHKISGLVWAELGHLASIGCIKFREELRLMMVLPTGSS